MTVLGPLLRKGLTVIADEKPRFLLGGGAQTVAGTKVSPVSSLQAVAVYAATSLIAQTIASMPVEFMLRQDDTREPQRPEEVRALWERPNADQTIEAFWETVILSILLWGNFYGAVRRNNRGDVVELWPIDPERIQHVERVTSAGQVGLRFRISENDPEWITNAPGKPVRILHIAGLTLPGRIQGMSPVMQAMETIGFAQSAQETAARFLGEGTHLSGVIQAKESLDTDAAKQLWDGWQLSKAGPRKAGHVAVLGGGAEFQGLSIPPQELQFLEQMKYGDAKIASLYRVPPHMVGDVERSTSWGTGIEEQTKGFVQFTLMPLNIKIEQAVNRTFLRDTDIRMKFNVNGLLRGSVKDRAEFYKAMTEIGVLSANRILALEDMPPVPHGDIRYVPMNWRPTDEPFRQPNARETAGVA